MYGVFNQATSFNGDISSWNTAAVTNMVVMFNGPSAFNHNLSSWCVTNIGGLPANFDSSSGLESSNRPLWGTCT